MRRNMAPNRYKGANCAQTPHQCQRHVCQTYEVTKKQCISVQTWLQLALTFTTLIITSERIAGLANCLIVL